MHKPIPSRDRIPVTVHGGALAGCAAALSALQTGAPAVVYEKSRFPRHKVCGEFLSHGVETVFRKLDLWEPFLRLNPGRMTRLELHFPSKSFSYSLPNPCWGLSRYAMDTWLMETAISRGVEWRNQPAPSDVGSDEVATNIVLAHGRREQAPKGGRTFGFKAHHAGPATETIELHFFDGCYVGVNPAENGIVNVCGLGPESVLRSHNFNYDALCQRSPTLRSRRATLERTMDWMSVGPLVYRNRFWAPAREGLYPAGDALGFVDPFTGTGMLNALLSGYLAGIAAASGQSVTDYLRECRHMLHRPFLVSSVFRKALSSGVAERGAGWLPGSWLFRLTRAQLG